MTPEPVSTSIHQNTLVNLISGNRLLLEGHRAKEYADDLDQKIADLKRDSREARKLAREKLNRAYEVLIGRVLPGDWDLP
jgi:hypothetical protein